MDKTLLLRLSSAFKQGIDNIKANFFHTFLSILGIIIGVSALVVILSLIDGMEKYAKEQISKTTNINSISIDPKEFETVDGVRVRKENFTKLNYEAFKELESSISRKVHGYFGSRNSRIFKIDGIAQPIGGYLSRSVWPPAPNIEIIEGKGFLPEDIHNGNKVIVLNNFLADTMIAKLKLGNVLGHIIIIDNQDFEVIGICNSRKGSTLFETYIPATIYRDSQSTRAMFMADSPEDVPVIKSEINHWLKENITNGERNFNVVTNEFRVGQANKGFLVFRLVMSLITGLSVIVGGIGVMNVLLISVSERTREIGIRKAIGAKKADIVLLFLTESISISGFGSLLGLLLGLILTTIIVPTVRHLAEVPFFQADYTANTLVIICLVALLVGIIFGTYPAIRAGRLNPIDAIRAE